MIMSPDRGGIFDALLRLVRFGLGGTAGSGQQFISWIHDADFLSALKFVMARQDFAGSVNLSSPNPVPNRKFMRALRQAWGTRIGLPAAKWMLEIGSGSTHRDRTGAQEPPRCSRSPSRCWLPIPISRLVRRRAKSGGAMAVGRQLENRNCQDFLALTILGYAPIIIRLWLNLRTTLGVAVGLGNGWGDRAMFRIFSRRRAGQHHSPS